MVSVPNLSVPKSESEGITMAINIEKSVLDNIATKATFMAEQYETEIKSEQIARAENRSAYLNGMSFVLEQLGYIFQYTDNTHIFIDTIENAINRHKK